MPPRPPTSPRTDTLFPYTTRYRSKREKWEATAGFRQKYGQAVYLFNPTDPEGRTARYNPLGYIDRTDPDQVVIELQKIATMLFVPPERGEPFWTDSAR